MKAYITSIGEKTLNLCKWSLERNGFDVEVIEGDNSLAEKLKTIYEKADSDFLRVDADVIPNRNITPDFLSTFTDKEIWWLQFQTFDWCKQDNTYGGVQFIRKEALPYLRENINNHLNAERPESEMSRIKEFYDPRRFISVQIVTGLHNYKNDTKRVIKTKSRRGQMNNYDFELAQRIDEL